MNKVWKSNAYKNTKVDYIKSQMQINQLLEKNGIKDFQHTQSKDSGTIVFLKELEVENKKIKVGVKITLPDLAEQTRNQLYRALFYYLKAKFESLTFGFVEEYNEAFVKEFMPYLVTDKNGRTIADLVIPKLNNALTYTPQGEQLYLEERKENEEELDDDLKTEQKLRAEERFIDVEYEEEIKGEKLK